MKHYTAVILILAVAISVSCGKEKVVPVAPANGIEQLAIPLLIAKTGQVQKTEINSATGTRVVLGRETESLKMTLSISEVYGDQSTQIMVRDATLAQGILHILNSNTNWPDGIQARPPEEAFIDASVDAAMSGPYIFRIDQLLESRGLSFTVGVDDSGNYYFGNKEVTPELKIWFSFPG